MKNDKPAEKPASPGRFRRHPGIAGIIERVLLILIPVIGLIAIFNVLIYFGIGFWTEQYLAIMLAVVTAVVPLIVPIKKKLPMTKLPPWYDMVLAVIGAVIWIYVALNYQALATEVGLITTFKVVVGIAAILTILECVRRFVGWPIAIVVLVFVLYAVFANFVPGPLNARAIPFDRLITHIFIDSGSMLGVPLKIVGTIVLAFMLFGSALFIGGAGQTLTDLAMGLMGRYRGGPAKVCIFGSTIFGMIAGNVAANVATVGTVTIPLMKKTGYSPEFAAAVEATASTGGQISPPIMGAAAFLMAQFLGLPYSTVAIAAIIPAILYYVGLFTQADLEAVKLGLKGLPREQLPSLRKALRYSYELIIPVAVLVYTLFIIRLQPEASAIYSTLSIFVVGAFRKESRLNLQRFLGLLENTGRGVIEIIVIAAAVGCVIGVTSITGLAFSFAAALVGLAGGNLFVLLLLAAIGSILLGMGATATAVYLFVVILIAPALIQLGMVPLAAHMFVFYFAIASFLVPPICIAVYTASSIAHSKPFQTALKAMTLAIAAFVVPFAFALDPALILQGSPLAIIVGFFSAAIGIVCIAIGAEGIFFRKFAWPIRIVFFLAGFALLSPFWFAKIGGAVVFIGMFLLQWRVARSANRMESLALQVDPALPAEAVVEIESGKPMENNVTDGPK